MTNLQLDQNTEPEPSDAAIRFDREQSDVPYLESG